MTEIKIFCTVAK